jgi:hypothetical protein
MDLYNPAYNISLDAKAPMTGRKHSNATIKKFKSRIPIRGKDHYNYGKALSESTKEKMSQSRTGGKRSVATKKKMSDTAKRINAISRIDRTKQMKKVIDSDGNIFNSLAECANFWEMSVQAVCDVLKGRSKKTKKGITFSYII